MSLRSLRSVRSWFGPWAAGGVIVAGIAAGCSSNSNSSGPVASDAGATEGGPRKLLDDAAAGGGDDGGGGDGGAFDGTTGQACTTDKDCASPNGPGRNKCSSDYSLTFSGVIVQLWSTPVCLMPPTSPNCDPAPAGDPPGEVHFCDGNGPDDETSPGLCVPNDMTNPQPMQGTCYPKCTIPLDGSKPSTCVGSNVCQPAGVMGVASGSPTTVIGYCQSLCQTDSDCAALGAGYGCQTDIGNCTLKKVVRTKAIGAPCAASTDGGADDTTTGACNCLSGSSGAGFCSSLCVVGGAPCPNGWVCDASQTAMTFPGATLTKQTQGIPGLCLPPCAANDAGSPATTTEGDAAVDGASPASPQEAGTPLEAGAGTQGQCPAPWTCMSTTLAGPDCMP